MPDDTMFETRLAAALGRYAELAPTMDDAAMASVAIEAGRTGRAGRFTWLRGAVRGAFAPTPAARLAYVLVALLLLAAALIAVAGGYFNNESRPPLRGNGQIVYSIGGNNHEAVVSVGIGPDGSDDHPIEAGRCPAYSADGRVITWLAYDGAAYLVVAGPDGLATHNLKLVEQPRRTVSYAVSPDGSSVAWFKPATSAPSPSDLNGAPASTDDLMELWVAPLDGGPSERIVAASRLAGEFYDAPVWSPDGGRIAFGTYREDAATGVTRRLAIDVVAADGSDRQRVADRPGRLGDGLSWSPDGHYLAYAGLADGLSSPATPGAVSAADGPVDLFLIGADGFGDRNLTGTPTTERDPEWAPDGAFIAFETAEDGVPDRVSTIPVVGNSGAGPPLPGPPSDWFVWSPDGRQLLWQELTTVGAETYRTTLYAVDREFQHPPMVLQVVDGLIVCPPSWQRLTP